MAKRKQPIDDPQTQRRLVAAEALANLVEIDLKDFGGDDLFDAGVSAADYFIAVRHRRPTRAEMQAALAAVLDDLDEYGFVEAAKD